MPTRSLSEVLSQHIVVVIILVGRLSVEWRRRPASHADAVEAKKRA